MTTTDDLAEGATNLYYTDVRADARVAAGVAAHEAAADPHTQYTTATEAQAIADAKIASAITNGDTTHAPSGDVVFDALAGKMSDTAIAARADSAAVQSIASGAYQKVLLATEVFDSGFYDPVTSKFTPTVAGLYLCVGAVSVTPAVTVGKRLLCAVAKNGVVSESNAVSAHDQLTNVIQHVIVYQMNGTTDYLELHARQDSGVSMSITGSSNTNMTVYRIGG